MRNKKAVLLLTFIIIMVLLSSGCLFNLRPVIEAISDQIGKVGQEFIYQVIVITYDPDNELTYSLTEKPEGMQIGSSTGLITWTPGEDQIGTFTVEVKVSNGNSFNVKQFKITIEDIFLTSIEVSPVTLSIYVGNSKTITSVTAYYDDGSSANIPLADSDYTSSDPNIATVSGSGVITGVSTGTATITVTYTEGGITKTNTVNVTVPSLTSIEVSPLTMSIIVGNSQKITSITAYYSDGSNAPVGLASAIYSSNKPGIATVSTTGRVTGVSIGTATITVSYTEEGITKTDTVSVTVSQAPKVLTKIEVSPTPMNIYVGSSQKITSITAYYSDGSNAPVGLASALYSSNNPGIATVSTTGWVTGVSVGSATITVSYTEEGITKTDTVNVTVSQAPKVLTSITVLPSSMTIRKGQSKTITSVTAHYNNSPDANISLSACTYESNQANVTVTNGEITVSPICAATTAVITVRYTEGGVTKSDTVNVTITGGG